MKRGTVSKKRRPKDAVTWSDVIALQEKIALMLERDAETNSRLAAMHRQLAKDLRALFAGKLIQA